MAYTLYNTDELLLSASLMEEEGRADEAARLYQKVIKSSPQNEKALGRLMVIYRKLKNYPEELKIIDSLISRERDLFKPDREQKGNVAALSKKINRALGRVDSKGKELYLSEQLSKLEKRRESVLAKIKKG